MVHTCMSHVTHMNTSCHIECRSAKQLSCPTWHEWVTSHIWMSHVTQMNESCHTENGRGKQPTITKCNKTSHGPPLRHLCRPCHRHNTWRSKRRGSCGYCRRVRTQCHTVCCSTLQGVAGCSKVLCALQTGPNPVSHCVLQGVAVFKGVLGVVDGSELSATLCVTGCCSVFQCVAGCFCAFKGVCGHCRRVWTQCHAVSYRVLQCISVLRGVSVYSKVLWALSTGPHSESHATRKWVVSHLWRRLWMSRATHWETAHTGSCKWGLSHWWMSLWMSRAPYWEVARRGSYERSVNARKWVMSHIWRRHVTQVQSLSDTHTCTNTDTPTYTHTHILPKAPRHTTRKHMHTHKSIHTRTQTPTRKRTHAHTYTRAHAHTHTHTHTHTVKPANTDTLQGLMHSHVWRVICHVSHDDGWHGTRARVMSRMNESCHTDLTPVSIENTQAPTTHTHVHTHTHTQRERDTHTHTHGRCIYHTHTHTHTYTHTQTERETYAHTHTHTHAHTHAHTHTHAHSHTNTNTHMHAHTLHTHTNRHIHTHIHTQ